MTQERSPLILVIDDVPEFRQNLLPKMAASMGCRSEGASTVQEAIKIAAEHCPDSDDPVNLAIIDMHMPYDQKTATKIIDDAGTQCLQLIAQFRLLKFPCVVFTAFPSFSDCVAAAKAGADAYIPKVRRSDEGGPDALRETCERLLRSHEEAKESQPTRAWIERNHEWLTAGFSGKWVAFVPRDAVKNGEVLSEPERDGVILLAGDRYEDVRAKVLEDASVLESKPVILLVRGKQSAAHKKEE